MIRSKKRVIKQLIMEGIEYFGENDDEEQERGHTEDKKGDRKIPPVEKAGQTAVHNSSFSTASSDTRTKVKKEKMREEEETGSKRRKLDHTGMYIPSSHGNGHQNNSSASDSNQSSALASACLNPASAAAAAAAPAAAAVVPSSSSSGASFSSSASSVSGSNNNQTNYNHSIDSKVNVPSASLQERLLGELKKDFEERKRGPAGGGEVGGGQQPTGGLTARDLARVLRSDRKSINSLLYKMVKKDLVVKDAAGGGAPLWSFNPNPKANTFTDGFPSAEKQNADNDSYWDISSKRRVSV